MSIRVPNMYRAATIILSAAAIQASLPEASAQQRLEPGETRVTRSAPKSVDGEDDEERKRRDADGSDSADEQPPKRPGMERFSDVEVRRVRPDTLPPPSASETDIPAVLRKGTGNLPAPPSVDHLEQTTDFVRRRVYELVSVQPSRGPGDGTPVVRHGHAVVVSGAKGPPLLVTTYYWLERSEELYLAPPGLSTGGDGSDGVPTAERRSVEEMTVDGRGDRWLEAHRDSLIPAQLYRPDEHRNLATVIPTDVEATDLPNEGMELFDLEKSSPVRLYGYSPRSGAGLSQTRILASHPDQKSLVYYLQTPYSMLYAAPVVSTEGKLLVLTAFQHPKKSDIVLVVPPAPLAAYVEDVLATL